MKLNYVTRRLIAVIACLAIMLSALAPSVSFAISSQDATTSSGFFVCSSVKLPDQLSDAQNTSSSQTQDQIKHTEHCPFCMTHAGSFALPPTLAPVLPVQVQQSLVPSLFYESHSPLFVWASVQSRAPPLVS